MKKIIPFFRKHKCIPKLIGCVIMVLPIIIYFMKFRHFSISNNPEDWGIFGDYIGRIYGGFFACLIMILVIYLAHALNKEDEKRKKISQVAEDLYNQIKKIESNNYNLNSINKLRRDINNNSLYIKGIMDDLIDLCDNFQSISDQTASEDFKLKEHVLSQLESLYEK